jgi:hypothetical protein
MKCQEKSRTGVIKGKGHKQLRHISHTHTKRLWSHLFLSERWKKWMTSAAAFEHACSLLSRYRETDRQTDRQTHTHTCPRKHTQKNKHTHSHTHILHAQAMVLLSCFQNGLYSKGTIGLLHTCTCTSSPKSRTLLLLKTTAIAWYIGPRWNKPSARGVRRSTKRANKHLVRNRHTYGAAAFAHGCG